MCLAVKHTAIIESRVEALVASMVARKRVAYDKATTTADKHRCLRNQVYYLIAHAEGYAGKGRQFATPECVHEAVKAQFRGE